MSDLESLLDISVGLTQAVSSKDRYDRFLKAIRRLIPCDAASLMHLDANGELRPLAAFGLSQKALLKTYPVNQHPRLEIICNSDGPVIFPSDSRMADPFDELIGEEEASPGDVHSCMGSVLTVNKKRIGIFTLDALKPGAFDDLDDRFLQLLSALAGAALNTSLMIESLETRHTEQKQLSDELLKVEDQRAGDLLGKSKPMIQLKRDIKAVSRSDFSVLIQGDSGVGKELVAREIHRQSKRSGKPLIYVNCAALPETLAESELFGHIKGAFTGATADRAGKFEVANNGTLFLDEIGELPLAVQAKLLRALQEGEIQRVGQDTPKTVNVRIVAATNRDLEKECRQGRFRNDLFHRLNVYPIRVASLHERLDDLNVLTKHFVNDASRALGILEVSIPGDTFLKLKTYPWPGNIRELKNAVSRALLNALSEQDAKSIILSEEYFEGYKSTQLPQQESATSSEVSIPRNLPLKERVIEFQRGEILAALRAADGNWSKAASALGLDRSNLHNLAKRIGLKD